MRLGLLVLLSACGRINFDPLGPHDDDGTHSGARLKMVWNEFEGGLRQPFQIYDTVLDATCRLEATGSPLRCVPNALNGDYFLDSACTQHAAVSNCPECQYIAVSGSPTRYYERVPSSATMLYHFDGASCTPQTTSGLPIYELGAEVSDTFAIVSIELAGSGRLQAQYYVSDDGFRFETIPYDTTLGAGCSPSFTPNGDYACIPLPNAYGTYASDASCSQHIARWDQPGPGPRFAQGVTTAVTSCGGEPNILLVANEVTVPPTVYQDFGQPGGCQIAVTTPASRFFALGAGVSLARLSHEIATVPDRRIQAEYLRAQGLVWRDPESQFDTVLSTDCEVRYLDDGQPYCFGLDVAGVIDVFQDPGCTMPIQLARISWFDDGCEVPSTPRYALNVASLLDVGAEYTTAQYTGSSSACFPRTLVPGAHERSFRLGPPADLGALAHVSIVQDP